MGAKLKNISQLASNGIDGVGSEVERMLGQVDGHAGHTKTNLVTATGVVFFAVVVFALTVILLFVRKRKSNQSNLFDNFIVLQESTQLEEDWQSEQYSISDEEI